MHYVEQSGKSVLTSHPTYKDYSEGYTHLALIDHTTGSVHTGLSLNQLAAEGTLSPHVHSYLAKASDVLWTSVGCVHAFANVSAEPVRWLETFSPQPPAENVFRFMAKWEQRAKRLHHIDTRQ